MLLGFLLFPLPYYRLVHLQVSPIMSCCIRNDLPPLL
jgi:hypothetical protein